MENFKLFTLVGGISSQSLNQKYFGAIKNEQGDQFEFTSYDLTRLPYFSQDIENDPPDSVLEFKEKIREAHGILIITPEYNRSFPGVLKNAIDWGSRPHGESLWKDKPTALLGASPGNIGTFGAQNHLRQVLAYLDMPVLGQPQIYFSAQDAFDNSGKFKDQKTIQLIDKFFQNFHDFIASSMQQSQSTNHHYKSQGLEDSPFAH